jgi:ATP-dependent Lon protease
MAVSISNDINILSVPVLPLRDVVVYPYMVVPLFVGRDRSIKALEVAMVADKQILLATQKNATDDQPKEENIHEVGTLATVLQLLKLPDGTVKVLVEGVKRGKIIRFLENKDYFLADVELIEDQTTTGQEQEVEIFIRSLKSQFEQYVKLNRKIPVEIMASILAIEDGSRLGDTIAAHLNVKLDKKQKLLANANLKDRLEKLMASLAEEIELLKVEKRIHGRVKKQMEKTQKEYYLNEQLKAIQKELNEVENVPNEFEAIAEKIKNAKMSNEAETKTKAELTKLRTMPAQSAESTVSRNYLDVMLSLPWNKQSKKKKMSLSEGEAVLDAEHYGLKDVKERIIEYIAVQKRVKKIKGPILCLVGPPGVGKTSLGQSIAHATGRKFVRMSLGGVRDEAEIRGHRRTYIGAMPGKIIQKLGKVGEADPLFLLDEIDKMSMDGFRGDPASALLEVLDPEQNHSFNDHYLEVDYDLSKVMFVATANSLNIPDALRDRMEVIRIPGYTEEEKINIALRHLIPKQIEAAGLKVSEIEIPEDTVENIIRYYTREAGVRNLEREISKICRKVVKEVLLKTKESKANIEPEDLEHYLGVRRYRYDLAEQQDQIGQVKGLAWTEVGGELLSIEAIVLPGKGKMIYTGQLGEVMQESIQAALSVVRARSSALGIAKNFFEKHDIHIHVPEGATPKDGPSAGISMCTALVSVMAQIPVRADFAMTGEITLRGEVLPIGGLKEKLLAAHRSGIKNVIIPVENVKDLKEIPDNILQDLNILPVRWIDEVLNAALNGYRARLKQKRKVIKSKKIKSALAGHVNKKEKIRKTDRVRTH